MSRRSLLVRLTGAAVGIGAIAFAAATIDSPLEPGGDGGTGGEGDGGIPEQAPPMEPDPVGGGLPPFLEYLVMVLLVVLAIVFAWYLLSNRREAVRLIAVALVLALVGGVVVYLLSHVDLNVAMNETPQPPEEPPPENGSGGEPGSGDGTGDSFPVGTLLMLLGAIAAVFVGALALSGREDEDATGTAVDPDAEDENEHTAAVGAAAGRAAERIEESSGEDVDNEVYRAWRDMTRLLEVPRPETSTPGEFAEAAIETGLAREHVDELTRLFEDVRYGHAEMTDETETRAVRTLRLIEAEYTGDESTSDEADSGTEAGTTRSERP